MFTNRTFYIKEETQEKLKWIMAKYRKSGSKIVDELISQKYTLINRCKKPKEKESENVSLITYE